MLRKLQESSNMTIGKSIDTEKMQSKKETVAGREGRAYAWNYSIHALAFNILM